MMHGTAMFAPLSPDEIAAVDATTAQPADKLPIVPVPTDAPSPETYRHPKHGAASKVWRYTDALDQLMFTVARFDFLDDDGKPAKDILPLTFCDIGKGRRAWRAKGIAGPRPLYSLPDITARLDAVLIVAEGEKSADAAAILFPDMVATTPPHGAKSPHKADWTPVAGRTVIIATDNDEAGQQFGDKVCELAARLALNRCCTCRPIVSALGCGRAARNTFARGSFRRAGILPMHSMTDGPPRPSPR